MSSHTLGARRGRVIDIWTPEDKAFWEREGEAIAWHLVGALKIPPDRATRVTFNEITKRGVLEAFKKPGDISMPRVNACCTSSARSANSCTRCSSMVSPAAAGHREAQAMASSSDATSIIQ